MEQKPFFSIIVPVYNVEKYLDKAIRSILKQTFQNFELILVEDCSVDNSYKICCEFAENDKRIKIIQNKYNKGAAGARNFGLKECCGKYLGFVDSDDYIEKDFLENAYYNLKEEWYDCIKYGAIEEYYDKREKLVYKRVCELSNETLFNKNLILRKALELEQIPLFGYLWNTFYKREIVINRNIQFNEVYSVNEDFDFNIQYLMNINSLKCINYCGYHYSKRDCNSLSTKKQIDYYDNHMMKIKQFLKIFKMYNALTPDIKEKIFWLYTRYSYSFIVRNISSNPKEALMKIKNDKLFNEFKKIKFKSCDCKQMCMIYLLKSSYTNTIIAATILVSVIKKFFPISFIKIKR